MSYDLEGYGVCDFDETNSFYSEKRRKANKEHVCCETGIQIHPGHHYWCCTVGFDGTVTSHKQCESAYHFCRFISIHLIGECHIPFGGLKDFLHDLGYQKWTEVLNSVFEEIKSGKLVFTSDDQAKAECERRNVNRES